MIRKYYIYMLLIIIIFYGCINKKSNEIETIENEYTEDHHLLNNVLYVAPYIGINLYSEPNITSTIIDLIPQQTELIIFEQHDIKQTKADLQ